jgi:hypothetical protein
VDGTQNYHHPNGYAHRYHQWWLKFEGVFSALLPMLVILPFVFPLISECYIVWTKFPNIKHPCV